MKKVDLSLPPANLTVMVHGLYGAGKTRFAGTFPKPRFLSDMSERGFETLRTMPKSALYDPAVMPEVWGIEHPRDMLEAIKTTADEVATKKPNAPLTLVIDSITFYANSFFDTMAAAQAKPDTRALYGDLLQHLRRVMIMTHNIPINVVWLALTKAPEDAMSMAGLMIPGQSAYVLPAAVQYFLYMRTVTEGAKSVVKHEVRTKPTGQFPARCRDGGTLPDVLPEPSYKCFMECLTNTTTTTTAQKG